jgi:hypothetical protein
VRTAALPDTRNGMRVEQLLTALLTDRSSEQTVPGIAESTALVRRERERERGGERERESENMTGGWVRHAGRATALTATTEAIRKLPALRCPVGTRSSFL